MSASADAGTTVATVGTNTVTWNGPIAGTTSVNLAITATVNSGAGGTTISNQATVAWDSDGDETNDASALSDDPATEPIGDPTDFDVPVPPTTTTSTTTTSTTTTAPPATTTTAPASTSTTAAPAATTTAATVATTTTVDPALVGNAGASQTTTTTAPTPTAVNDSLAFTGSSEARWLTIMGASLVGLGLTVLATTRRRTTSTD